MRYLFAIPSSVLIAMMLFSFMAWMVDNGRTHKPEITQALQFDMVMMDTDSETHRRQRSVPEQPKTPPAPAVNQTSAQLATPEIDTSSYESPVAQLNINTEIKGVSIQAPNLGKLSDNRQLMPIYRVEPNYPTRALRRNIEGYVVVKFDIDEDGHPFNIQIIDSNPNNIFDREALRAVRRWKYQPGIENGHASVIKGQQTKVEFRIAK